MFTWLLVLDTFIISVIKYLVENILGSKDFFLVTQFRRIQSIVAVKAWVGKTGDAQEETEIEFKGQPFFFTPFFFLSEVLSHEPEC